MDTNKKARRRRTDGKVGDRPHNRLETTYYIQRTESQFHVCILYIRTPIAYIRTLKRLAACPRLRCLRPRDREGLFRRPNHIIMHYLCL